MTAIPHDVAIRDLLTLVQDLDDSMAARLAGLANAVLTDIRTATVASDAPLPHLRAKVELTLQDTENPVMGAGFVGGAPVFTSHALRWWYRPAAGAAAKPLAVSTQPDRVGYYDVENTEWWTLALGTSTPINSGPYVDFAGTNAYVVTFAQSVRRDGRLCGVVVADIAVGDLQSRWQQTLLRAPRETSVVSSDGAVIATNTGELLGDAIDLDEDDVVATPIPGMSWLVVHSPES